MDDTRAASRAEARVQELVSVLIRTHGFAPPKIREWLYEPSPRAGARPFDNISVKHLIAGKVLRKSGKRQGSMRAPKVANMKER